MKILAGDIGGTSTRLVYADVSDNNYRILAEKVYSSQDYESFISLLESFLKEHAVLVPVDSACFAIAGPVMDDVVKVTNLPWLIKRKHLRKLLATDNVELINDFIAVAHGVPMLHQSDLIVLQEGVQKESTIENRDAVVVGAGTGFGAAHIVWQEDRYQAFSSEAGHAGFAPGNRLQLELLGWMQKQHSHVSLELLLSGSGIKRIYDFFKEVKYTPETITVEQQMLHRDPAQVITEHALANDDEICIKTIDCFIDIYAVATSNIALHYYPVSTVYIAGGIAPKLRARLKSQAFIDAFTDKGLMTSNIRGLKVNLVTQEKSGLYGALSYAVRRLE